MGKKEWKKYVLLNTINLGSRKEGFCKYYPNNSKLHEQIKWEIFTYLKDRGYLVYSEVEFKNKKRADICAISKEGKGYIIEVLNSESEERFNEKLNTYPIEWEIIAVHCKGFDINELGL